MSVTVDEIYDSIGQNAIENLPTEWSEAFIDAERSADDALKLSGGYSSIDLEFTSFKFRKFDRRIVDEFHELYSIMTKEGDQHKWNRAKFKLTPDGKFSIDFDWDQALADEVTRLNS